MHHPTGISWISRGALAGTRNSSMGSSRRIDQTTHCIMSARSTTEVRRRMYVVCAVICWRVAYIYDTSRTHTHTHAHTHTHTHTHTKRERRPPLPNQTANHHQNQPSLSSQKKKKKKKKEANKQQSKIPQKHTR